MFLDLGNHQEQQLVFLQIQVIFYPPATITLHKGIVSTTTGSFGNQSKTFCILDDISVPVFNNIASFNDISIYEGTLLSSNFTYSTRVPNQKFILPNSGVDTSLISVTVKNNENSSASTKYSNQDSLFDIGGQSKTYFLQEISDERYEIFFGDNIFGKALEEGNFITTNYIVSSGDSGNGISSFQFSGRLTYTRNAQTYAVTSGISLLTTGLTSSGGDTIESVESIRRYAPRIYAAQNRALTAGDYETLIPAKIYPETESISVFGGEELIPPQLSLIHI